MIPDKNVVTQSITLLIDLLKFDALLNLLIFNVYPTQQSRSQLICSTLAKQILCSFV